MVQPSKYISNPFIPNSKSSSPSPLLVLFTFTSSLDHGKQPLNSLHAPIFGHLQPPLPPSSHMMALSLFTSQFHQHLLRKAFCVCLFLNYILKISVMSPNFIVFIVFLMPEIILLLYLFSFYLLHQEVSHMRAVTGLSQSPSLFQHYQKPLAQNRHDKHLSNK